MKQMILIIGMLITSSLVSYASLPDNLEEYGQIEFSPTDPEYEWSQIDSKQIKVELKSQTLMIESNKLDGFACSITELPINVEDTPEFIFGFTLKGFTPSDNSKNEKLASKLMNKVGNSDNILMIGSFGMLFDYQDIHNYKAIAIFKKTFQYYVMKDGILSMVKSGPVKHKGNSFKLIMMRENGGIEFQLNGIEVCKLRRITLTSSYFGVFINGKGKAEMPSFMMCVPEQEDTEQSTSNT